MPTNRSGPKLAMAELAAALNCAEHQVVAVGAGAPEETQVREEPASSANAEDIVKLKGKGGGKGKAAGAKADTKGKPKARPKARPRAIEV